MPEPAQSSATPTAPLPPDIAAMDFEAALSELEATVKKLEEGRGKLDDALATFERGTHLRRHCENKLAEAQSRIDKIIVKPDGNIELGRMDG
ncbi:MAG: exodeoxyribonuclease VII small subunit [Alphaproteobacteria bacterium]|nr:exodeoxyribonuclease VII small subunit [Alphaproteobacteria bacterium]